MKQFYKSTLLLVATVFAFVSCDSTEEPVAPELSLKIEPTEVTFTFEGGSQTIDITSNVEWAVETITEDADWLTFDNMSGSNNGSIEVTVDENTTDESRTFKFYVKGVGLDAQKVTVVQQIQAKLQVSTQELSLTPSGGEQNIEITSNCDWSIFIESGEEWLTLGDTEGTGNKEVTLSASANTTGATREGEISVSSEGIEPIKIKVSQSYQMASDVEYEVIASGEIVIAPMEVGSSTVILDADPQEYEGVYYIFIVDEYTYSYAGLNEDNIAEYAIEMGSQQFANYVSADDYFTFTGALTNHLLYPNGPNVIYPDTDMYLMAVGVDGAADITTDVTLVKFRTPDVVVDENFNVDINLRSVKDYYAEVTYTPTDDNTRYYSEIIETSVLGYYDTDEEFMSHVCQYDIDAGALVYTTSTGVLAESVGLKPNTEYTAVAFAYESGKYASKLSKVSFTTKEEIPFSFFDGTIDFTIENNRQPHITVSSSTNGYEGSYYISVVDKPWYEDYYDSPEAFMEASINMDKIYSQGVVNFPAPNGCKIFVGDLNSYEITDMTWRLEEEGTYDMVMGVVGIWGTDAQIQSNVSIVEFSIIVDENNVYRVEMK